MTTKTPRVRLGFILCLFLLALLVLLLFGTSGCAAMHAQPPNYQFAFARPSIDCVLSEHEIGRMDVWACPQQVTNVTAKAPCDESLKSHLYHPARLVLKQACISVTGTLVDASHGRNTDGCRHEADGDAHCFLRLDPGEEGLLNAMNRSDQAGNLVIEPICRYRVTQADAVEACKGWRQELVLPPPGSRVRVTGAYVLDSQHGHMELHPVSAIDVLK